jgi:transcription antitermination factor NusG
MAIVEKLKWYGVYTKPRWEKKVHALLREQGIESYCPINKVRRKWSDRIKTVEEPLFKSYVFVRIPEAEKTTVRMTPGVINFVYWMGKPAIVKDREIQAIKNFLNEHSEIMVEPIELRPNQKVRIQFGPFMDYQAVVVEVKKKIATVVIASLGIRLIAKVSTSSLGIYPNNHQ